MTYVYIHYTANIVMADSFLLARVYPFNLDLDLELDSGCIHVDASGHTPTPFLSH